MRWSLVVALMLVGGMLARPARACTCIPNPPPEEARAAAAGVFAAEVLDLEDVEGSYPSDLRVTLRIIQTFKGDYDETLVVRTANNSAACGFPFQKGGSYLVYVDREESNLRVSLCSRTAALADATEDLIAFGAEDLERSGDASNRRCGGPTNVAALQGMLFVFLLVAWQRRRQV